MKTSPKPTSQAIPVRERLEVAVADITPDERNRVIDEKAERFVELVDSVRVLGVLQPVHVQRMVGEGFRLVDGERRWRATRAAGLDRIPCEVWPVEVDDIAALVAAFVLNDPDKRDPHSCIYIARQLRQIKIARAFTNDLLAAFMGIPIDRVRTYMALFAASEILFEFFEEQSISLYLAAEFMRYEKAAGEPAARRLVKRHLETPLTIQEIAALRERGKKNQRSKSRAPASDGTAGEPLRRRLLSSLESEMRKDLASAVAALEPLLSGFGYRLVSVGKDAV